ncbi:hypothetical protein WIV_gp108 [Wiseana iridescent virus]|uniref:RNA polymerase Rpb7-like N-terminal domain-containing protein n=1 Tax=Wiseana iridescent virus TaxID=68347 RepID=G0T5D4_IRV9|nr:hypothetical protein WIV_gp108 [Wiseana iridescent virus]ADO00452.1 hypothetical protein [Wiseana iridescent virus]
MEPYFEEKFFTTELVLLPKYLNSNLSETLRSILINKYPKTYLDKGYCFNIKVVRILDNKITLSGQIVLKIEFKADIYVPKIGHVFQSELKKGVVNKYHWVEIGPLTIFINDISPSKSYGLIKVQITNIKSDNTLCFGKIIN